MRVLQNAIRIVRRGLLKLIQNSCAIRSSTKCLIEWKAVFLALYFIVNAPSPKTCFCLQITTFDETKGIACNTHCGSVYDPLGSYIAVTSCRHLTIPVSSKNTHIVKIFWIYMKCRVYHWWLLKYSCSAFCLAHSLDYSRNNLVTNHFHLQLV